MRPRDHGSSSGYGEKAVQYGNVLTLKKIIIYLHITFKEKTKKKKGNKTYLTTSHLSWRKKIVYYIMYFEK